MVTREGKGVIVDIKKQMYRGVRMTKRHNENVMVKFQLQC
jgi:hypothetical protein